MICICKNPFAEPKRQIQFLGTDSVLSTWSTLFTVAVRRPESQTVLSMRRGPEESKLFFFFFR